jgi:hypothetical protein
MELLGQYLSKYKDLTPPDASAKKALVALIHDVCGIHITEKAITIRYGGANIRCHPTERSEIARCAPRILHELQHTYNVRLSYLR